MLLTCKADYAVRIVQELTKNALETLPAICAKQHIPESFSYQIVPKLQKAGILKATRGPGGGFSLARDASTITLLDIYRAVQGGLPIVRCLAAGASCPLHSGGEPCAVHGELERVQALVEAALSEKSMAEILKD